MNNCRVRRPTHCVGTVILCVLLLGGCAVGPDYHKPEPGKIPEQWKAQAPWKQGTPRDAELKQSFWEVFSDPLLNSLEMEATTNSPDVRAAFERVEEARAVARVTRSDLFPTASFDPNADRTRFSAKRTVEPGSSVRGYTGNEFFLPLDLSYEIDLWGRVRRSFRAARETAQANAASYQNVLLSLQAQVAETYFMIRSVDLDRWVVGQSIGLRQTNLTLVESLHKGGADSALDLAEAQTELASAQAELLGLNLQRARLENMLGTLCGQPASTFSLAETSRTYRPPAIPVGLPSDLLERRPDVAQAERSMAAASEGIGVAKAAFFPSIQLTAAAGTESVDLKDVFSWESRAWSFGPNITFPLFEGGRLKADLQRARSAYEESVAQYRSQVLVAFHEVEDGLIGVRLLKEQFDTQMKAVDGAKKVADLSRLRYKEGLTSYLEVVVADRTLLDNEVTAYQLNGEGMVTTVQLIKALGGGWTTNAPMMTNSVAPLEKKK